MKPCRRRDEAAPDQRQQYETPDGYGSSVVDVNDARKVLLSAQKACSHLDEISEVYRRYESTPSSKNHIRFCGDGISTLLNDVMIPLLVEHPQLDDQLFGGRFDAKNFAVYK